MTHLNCSSKPQLLNTLSPTLSSNHIYNYLHNCRVLFGKKIRQLFVFKFFHETWYLKRQIYMIQRIKGTVELIILASSFISVNENFGNGWLICFHLFSSSCNLHRHMQHTKSEPLRYNFYTSFWYIREISLILHYIRIFSIKFCSTFNAFLSPETKSHRIIPYNIQIYLNSGCVSSAR